MENGLKSKNGKKLAKKKKMALGPKWGQNGPKMAKKKGSGVIFLIFSAFLGHFFPISGRGPFSIVWPIFSHFWISARFPFSTGGLTRNLWVKFRGSRALCFSDFLSLGRSPQRNSQNPEQLTELVMKC